MRSATVLVCLTCVLPALAVDGRAWPDAIEDNSFLVEEAYNQEPGVVQWITTAQYYRPAKDWAAQFTNELPVPDETIQLSYDIPWYRARGGDPSGLGDVSLNYRYQWLREDGNGVAFAPRLTIVLPTGNEKKGLGYGVVGFEINLPVSKRLSRGLAVHVNAGATYAPGAKTFDGDVRRKDDLFGVGGGASAVWLVSPTFNLMFEGTIARNDQPRPGGVEKVTVALISPGLRCAINTKKGQLVLGAAVPIGLTDDSPDSGIFFYASWEAPVWKAR
jgi:hypothetical protein